MDQVIEIDVTQVAARLRNVTTRLRRRLRRERGGDLSPAETSALASVVRLGPITLGELAEVEQVRPPTMTRTATALEEAGLVARVTGDDRRRAYLEPTAAGLQLLQRNDRRKNAYLARRLRELQPRELTIVDTATGILERLLEGE
jgi:DNA-binding MarR family transcriptional regulator